MKKIKKLTIDESSLSLLNDESMNLLRGGDAITPCQTNDHFYCSSPNYGIECTLDYVTCVTIEHDCPSEFTFDPDCFKRHCSGTFDDCMYPNW